MSTFSNLNVRYAKLIEMSKYVYLIRILSINIHIAIYPVSLYMVYSGI